jgi:predicted alpha/beta superfamily hydrolase
MTIYGDPEASTVLVQMVDDHDLAGIESELAQIQKLSDREFCLTAVKVSDWNHDLSPWQAPAVFGQEDFGGGAAGTLEEVLEICRDPDKTYIIGGYSLAGLFALWAAYRTDVFAAAACASPSVWFPGFADYMEQHPILVDSVYLSLGDREERTRNPVLSTVGDRIREAYELLRDTGTDCVLEWNRGNHFKEPDLRTAKAFAWLINRTEMERDGVLG